MTIIVFSPYYPPHTGGLESHSEEFNQHIAETGIGVHVFAPQLPKDSQEEENQGIQIKITRFPAFEIISNYPLPKFWAHNFWKSFRALWKYRPDIVISRTRFFPTSLLALIYARLRNIPLVHIEHGSDFVRLSSPSKTFLARLYDHLFGRIIFRYSDINISISQAVKKFVGRFDSRESPVIYRGINFKILDKIPRDSGVQTKYSEKIIMVTAARLYKWKGIENTIEAIRLLPEAIRSKICFFIIGNGEDFRRLERMIDGLPIVMLGELGRSNVISILKASDIYIHSSLPGGGLSTSLLEAMYCECAVVATPNEGAEEIIRHKENGLLIKNSEPKSIHDAIISLTNSQDIRTQLSRRAKRDIQGMFDWGKSIERYRNIFEYIQDEL